MLLAALAVEFFEKEDRKIHPKEALIAAPTTQWTTRKN